MSKPTVFAVAPAVRSVIVDVYEVTRPDGRREWTHEVYPIIALEWTVEADGCRRSKPLFFVPYVHESAICDPDDLDEGASASCAVSCPWPESEDAERLRPYVEMLIPKAVVNGERREERWAKAAASPPTGKYKYLEKFLANAEARKAEGGA